MGKIVGEENSENVITQEEVDKALQTIYDILQYSSTIQEDEEENLEKIEEDRHNLTFPSGDKVKTVFHSVDLEIEDIYGGKLSCTYEIRPTVEKIVDFLKTIFPKVTKEQIAEITGESGENYEEARKKLIYIFAEKIFYGRMAIGRFFHDELEKTLKIVIDDLIRDAELYTLSQFEYKLASASEFDKKSSKEYQKIRKQRVNVIVRKGRPQGKSLSQEELDNFLKQIETVFRELEAKKQKITKTAVARRLYIGHSNPVQQLNRFFERYDFVGFDEVLQNYKNGKEN